MTLELVWNKKAMMGGNDLLLLIWSSLVEKVAYGLYQFARCQSHRTQPVADAVLGSGAMQKNA